jgi:hypothetical protein
MGGSTNLHCLVLFYQVVATELVSSWDLYYSNRHVDNKIIANYKAIPV